MPENYPKDAIEPVPILPTSKILFEIGLPDGAESMIVTVSGASV